MLWYIWAIIILVLLIIFATALYECRRNPRLVPGALQERCCFYVNKSGIVRDKIKKLQEDLVKRRKELFDNPLWSGLNGLLPYLLPILGPLAGFLLMLTFGPWAFRKLTNFIKQQIDKALAKPIQIHYHRLAMLDQENLYDNYRGRQYNDYQPSIPTGGPH